MIRTYIEKKGYIIREEDMETIKTFAGDIKEVKKLIKISDFLYYRDNTPGLLDEAYAALLYEAEYPTRYRPITPIKKKFLKKYMNIRFG